MSSIVSTDLQKTVKIFHNSMESGQPFVFIPLRVIGEDEDGNKKYKISVHWSGDVFSEDGTEQILMVLNAAIGTINEQED